MERMARNLPKSEPDLEEMQIECKEIIESGDSQQKKTGEYSNTTKVARHGGKSSFSVGNVHGECTDLLPEYFESTEHSFAKGRGE